MRRSSLRAVTLCSIVFAGMGCSKSEPPAPAAAAPSGPGAGAPTASATAAAAPAGTEAATEFSVVATSDSAFELYSLGGAGFVDAAGFLAHLGDGPFQQD